MQTQTIKTKNIHNLPQYQRFQFLKSESIKCRFYNYVGSFKKTEIIPQSTQGIVIRKQNKTTTVIIVKGEGLIYKDYRLQYGKLYNALTISNKEKIFVIPTIKYKSIEEMNL